MHRSFSPASQTQPKPTTVPNATFNERQWPYYTVNFRDVSEVFKTGEGRVTHVDDKGHDLTPDSAAVLAYRLNQKIHPTSNIRSVEAILCAKGGATQI